MTPVLFDFCACRRCCRTVPFTCTSISLKVDFTPTPSARGSIADWRQFTPREVSQRPSGIPTGVPSNGVGLKNNQEMSSIIRNVFLSEADF